MIRRTHGGQTPPAQGPTPGLDPGRDLRVLSSPGLWPAWPMLPLVRRRPDGGTDYGLAYDCRGAPALAGLAATVFLCNLFLIPPTLDEFLALPRETYDSFEEVVAAGWAVD